MGVFQREARWRQSDVGKGRTGVHLLHYFGAVGKVDLTLWSDRVVHPLTLVQNTWVIEIPWQTSNDSVPLADQGGRPSLSPLSPRLDLVNLGVSRHGVDRVQKWADRHRPPIRSSDSTSLDLVRLAEFSIRLVGRHTPRSECNNQRLESSQVVVCLDGLDATVVELQSALMMMGEGQGWFGLQPAFGCPSWTEPLLRSSLLLSSLPVSSVSCTRKPAFERGQRSTS